MSWRITDARVQEAFQPYLQPGEQLQHWAYGFKPPHIVLTAALFVFGIILYPLLSKYYFVGLTNKRLLAIRLSLKMKVKEFTEYDLDRLSQVTTSTGPLFTHIRILDDGKPFVAKFHRLGMPNNRAHSMAIASVLEGQSGKS